MGSFMFPAIQPFNSGYLNVSPLHRIYFEESGNPEGKPVVILHGGPGGGSSPAMRRFHDPRHYRIVIFDQRGCGRSTPYAELRENTTWDLVADIERLRLHLGVENWQVFGGSWGSTLALAYAQTHPGRVAELILRGIFLLRRQEVEWFYQKGASALFPDYFAAYRDYIPEEERADLVAAYYKRLTGDDRDERREAARRWAQWEGSTLSLMPNPSRIDQFGEERMAIAFARIECHFFQHRGFFEVDGQLLRDIDRIRHIPGSIIQGRYDVVTPVEAAWDLHQAWPEADFTIVDDAGHTMSEPGLTEALIAATEKYKSAYVPAQRAHSAS
ncbi:prolyl aminopeptidase [Pseudovibrio sp. SPO723]|uniref:prolyl aminopeptidase n=1 Tax=Nesiotobacter zosterae TaxID=392721 RepID=UPI0029C38FA1|nr:prolyl aminopeptidase [Pseudovibrio sp. SPO723]MDX5593200.1 prolyl aminopeptidase [Pseudovibrio sp. SPO723]